ncbi:hypothetical protein ILYODFUR_011435 [Ilyodon furcidens]|uniref:Uncharacterized protein n=1 Tax=Ilyodon furcidens TaxID=33524 RepID=A0ABV0TXH8_9TELE
MLLQSIASSINGLKSGIDAVQAVVKKQGTRVTEAENLIAVLEDEDLGRELAVGAANIAQLREIITYLEDASSCNNVHIIRIIESVEGAEVCTDIFGGNFEH